SNFPPIVVYADPPATVFRENARIAVRRLAHSRGRHTDMKTYMLPKVPASHQNGASARSLWHHPDFLRLWAGQTISTVGSGITSSALPLTAVLLLGARATDMGWLLAAESAPVLLVGMFAGVWVDRFRRRPLLIGADLGRAALLACIPMLAAVGGLRIEYLFALAAAVGMLT